MQQAPEVNFPSTDLEVKIVLAIPFPGRSLQSGLRRAGFRLSPEVSRVRSADQSIQQQEPSNTL
jgi:hypothetical protein